MTQEEYSNRGYNNRVRAVGSHSIVFLLDFLDFLDILDALDILDSLSPLSQ